MELVSPVPFIVDKINSDAIAIKQLEKDLARGGTISGGIFVTAWEVRKIRSQAIGELGILLEVLTKTTIVSDEELDGVIKKLDAINERHAALSEAINILKKRQTALTDATMA
jgi:hypothetical protein